MLTTKDLFMNKITIIVSYAKCKKYIYKISHTAVF